jgi:hypothetical protein
MDVEYDTRPSHAAHSLGREQEEHIGDMPHS